MADDQTPEETPAPDAAEAREQVVAAIDAWYAAAFGGKAVITGWYLIANGIGFAADGAQLAFVAQDWDADIVDQLGLIEYARQRVAERMNDETR